MWQFKLAFWTMWLTLVVVSLVIGLESSIQPVMWFIIGIWAISTIVWFAAFMDSRNTLRYRYGLEFGDI